MLSGDEIDASDDDGSGDREAKCLNTCLSRLCALHDYCMGPTPTMEGEM